MIGYVASKAKHPDNVAVRATITREGSPYLKELWQAIYDRGVRQLIFHPLILSLGEGYIEWPEPEWAQFCNDIKDIIITHPDIEHFQVVEGVGAKGKTNCLIGSDEIAVDASGDFTGCYFFTNRKGDIAGNMLLGNIHDDHLYIDRYNSFKASYERMYYEHDECNTCSVKNLCYQCPAGNVATSGKLFRPDGMCKRIIQLYSDINELMIQNKFTRKYNDMLATSREQGDVILARALVHLMVYFFEDHRADPDEVICVVDAMEDNYRVTSEDIARYFIEMIEYANQEHTVKTSAMTPGSIVDGAKHRARLLGFYEKPEQSFSYDNMARLYELLRESDDLPPFSLPLKTWSAARVQLITLMHFLVMNTSEIRKRS